MKKLFVYGSLMFDEVCSKVIRGRHEKSNATLNNYARYTLTGETYPGIRRKLSASTNGVLILGLSRSELKLLDQFEGSIYRRKRVTVVLEDSTKISCETYALKKRYARRLSNTAWSEDIFRQQHLKHFLNTL